MQISPTQSPHEALLRAASLRITVYRITVYRQHACRHQEQPYFIFEDSKHSVTEFDKEFDTAIQEISEQSSSNVSCGRHSKGKIQTKCSQKQFGRSVVSGVANILQSRWFKIWLRCQVLSQPDGNQREAKRRDSADVAQRPCKPTSTLIRSVSILKRRKCTVASSSDGFATGHAPLWKILGQQLGLR